MWQLFAYKRQRPGGVVVNGTQGEDSPGGELQAGQESSGDAASSLRAREGAVTADGEGHQQANKDKAHISPAKQELRRAVESDLRKARRITWKWFAGLVGVFIAAVVTAIAGHVTDGWFSASSASKSSAIPSSPPAVTQVRVMQPFRPFGGLMPPYKAVQTWNRGQCSGSFASSDPTAMRCFAGGFLGDPCWANASLSYVVCLRAPWDNQAVVIRNPAINRENSWASPLPWALEIMDPAHVGQVLQCEFVAGAAGFELAGKRPNWACYKQGQFNPNLPIGSKNTIGYAFGAPKVSDSKPWTVYYAGVTDSQAFQATVIVAWR